LAGRAHEQRAPTCADLTYGFLYSSLTLGRADSSIEFEIVLALARETSGVTGVVDQLSVGKR